MKRNNMLKIILSIIFLFVTFFSVKDNVISASFKYNDFDWNEFLEQNKNYWTESCDGDEKCYDKLLKTKKKFYTRLYKLLDVATSKYGYIDDNLIIATVFYGLDPDTFQDPNDEYSPYNIDDNDSTKDKYIGSDDGDIDAAKEYFENETDSLKTLINSFIGYNSMCYGTSDETPTSYTDQSTGKTYLTCSVPELEPIGDKCVAKVSGPFKGSFFDSIGLSFVKSDNLKKCESDVLEKGYTSPELKTSSSKEVNEEFFWNYLENSRYFDTKKHLDNYFENVYKSNGYKSMKEFYDASETNTDLLDKYNDEIKEARQLIIKNIKEIIDAYGRENFSDISKQLNSVSKNKYWWPIGSSEVTNDGNIIMAVNDPEVINISNQFGIMMDSTTGEATNNLGIDIPGVLNSTNVIATMDGVVVKESVSEGILCEDNGDSSCGSGYGNYIIIEHVDGNYSLYANLALNSINVKVGDTVRQGQVIAKVGNSGASSTPHLHFEIRVGNMDKTAAQNPLNFVSTSEPRATNTNNQILEWIGNMEGTGPQEGEYYKVYADSGGVLTVGHGITLKYNGDLLRAYGINPDTLSVGSLVLKNTIDEIYGKVIDERLNNIKSKLAAKGITLNDNQVAALASLQYNCGNINGFFEAYDKYGSSNNLCQNWWEQKALHDKKGNLLKGLQKRRKAECDLFVNGNFNMNVYK